MALLSYSFCMGLLHSLWQAAMLRAVYLIAEKILGARFSPLQKKNLLFASLGLQMALFALTFCIYYAGNNSFTPVIDLSQINSALNRDAVKQITPWLFTIYIFVLAYKICVATYSWVLFKKQFKSNLVKPPVHLKLFVSAKQYHFGIKRKVQLWLSNNVPVPLTFGFFKPVIILPFALVNKISTQQAEALILHELAHIKANDFLLNWFLLAAETFFFFNPFVIALCKKVKTEREKSCDITVTAFAYPPLVYAEALLLAQAVKQEFAPVLVHESYRISAVSKPQHLLNRIQFFINPANQLQHSNKKILLPVISLTIVFAMAVAGLMQITGNYKQPEAIVLQEIPEPVLQEKELPVIVNNVLQNLNVEKIAEAAEKQQPAIEKQLKQLQPLIDEIQKNAEGLADAIATEYAVPASLQENDVKQIIVKEEQSGSKNATIKVYNLVYANGKWVLQPQWKLAAKEIILTDSLLIDTSAPAKNQSSVPGEIQD